MGRSADQRKSRPSGRPIPKKLLVGAGDGTLTHGLILGKDAL